VPADDARLGYLLSKYPSANHTYLLREVRGLRTAGFAVVVAAIDGDDRPEAGLPDAELEERAATYVVKRRGALEIAAAHLATLATRPAGYVAGLALAVRLARADVGRLAYNLFYFGEAVVAGRHLWRRGCTHVHTHYASNVAVLAARVFPFELSATIHGSAEFIDPVAQRLREKIAACDFVRAISMYGRSQLMLASPAHMWGKFEVVRLGVDAGEFSAGATPAAAPRPAPAPLRLVSVGQLQPAKGFYVLLDALASLVRSGRDVVLTIVGDGGERAGLEAHARRLGVGERVRFTGALHQGDVRAVLRDSDVFVLASFAEGVPVVLMEAMASGLACVATRITGIPELVEHGEDGLLVTPADDEALARAVARLDDDPDLRRRLGAAARGRVGREYDLHTNVRQLAAVFRRRVGRPRAAPA
jgi:glycosyltransferase involved in cell wall biosynthesis